MWRHIVVLRMESTYSRLPTPIGINGKVHRMPTDNRRMAIEREWVVRSPDPGTVDRLTDEIGCSPAMATVLANRGFDDPDEARHALRPTATAIHHPKDLPDDDRVVDRIETALDDGERIGIFADRDIDGVSGAAALVPLFEELEASVSVRIPGKWDGYGLSTEAVDAFADRGVSLLVAVDCGTTAHEAIERAGSRGIDVAVVDHHRPEDSLPPAVGVVNPRRVDSTYPQESLAAGAVAWKVGQLLVERRTPARIGSYHRRTLPLAAIATLGDYMPLTVENRAIVREGFDRLFDCGVPGLVALAHHCEVETIRDLGWSLVPLLNAGQEDESGTFTLEFLLADRPAAIRRTIDRLEAYREQRRANRRARRDYLEGLIAETFDPDRDALVFVETDRWVGGGPMSGFARELGRPVVTYREREDGYRGGGRSGSAVDLLDLYGECDELLDDWWGHPGAAGFRLAEANVDPFGRRLDRLVRDRFDPEELRPTVEADVVMSPAAVTPRLLEEFDDLRPFGSDNEEPTALFESVAFEACTWFGEDDAHCRLEPARDGPTSVGPSFVVWNGRETFDESTVPGRLDVLGTLAFDRFAKRPAVYVDDWRPAGGTTESENG